MTTLALGIAGGSQKLYVNIDRVMPGAKSCKFHRHSHQEEFFLVLAGSGILRLGEESMPVKTGDFFSKPAGSGLSHQFINDSDDVLEVLDVGVPSNDDVIEYPDENVVLVRAQKTAYKNGEQLENWSTDPNSIDL